MDFKVFYIGNVNGMQAEDAKSAEEFIKAREYAIIGTNRAGTGIRLSALSNLSQQNINELYFVTDTTSQKVENLNQNAVCELMYTDGNGQVILTGSAETLSDIESKKAVWQDWMIDHFTDGVEGNTLCIIKFKTSQVRAMLL